MCVKQMTEKTLYLFPNVSHWRFVILKYCYSKKVRMFAFKMISCCPNFKAKRIFFFVVHLGGFVPPQWNRHMWDRDLDLCFFLTA